MRHAAAELCPDRPRIGIVTVRRDAVRGHAGDGLCRSKEALGRSEVAALAEHHVYQGAITIDRAIEVLPVAVHPNIGLVAVPAAANFAFSASA